MGAHLNTTEADSRTEQRRDGSDQEWGLRGREEIEGCRWAFDPDMDQKGQP